LNSDTIQILSDAALIQAREKHFDRMRSLFAGKLSDLPFVLNGRTGCAKTSFYEDPEIWVEEALDDLAEHADQLLDPHVFRPQVIETWLYGVHFVDKILGAHVYDLDGTNNWQAHYLATPIGQLQGVDLEANETWNLAVRAARAFVNTGCTVPLFGLPVIASALNIALNLYGQEVIIAMYTDPDAVRHDLTVINDMLCEMHRRFIEIIPADQLQCVVGAWRTQPPGYGQICGCSSQLLSPELYADFIAPLDDQLLSVYPNGGMIHLCGGHTQHIPVWREMKSLKALQLNDRAAGDLPIYFRELREDQILYPSPCAEISVEKILEVTGGRRTVLVAEWDPSNRGFAAEML
jgi:hypothetical protein